ncbi:SPARC-related modular calcium-binding protein 1-like isoform X2 [Xenia sp. Carnegie-2017]|uniref:SPARC-related modular calcium-binding protein 1-like isoform X2 n=1 Tax=Xenia sp. Carnegie-2017 TaxID=2897299 RepID=UPI001F03CE5F|nr:SPARC-related modular calcium-binding protein 1-like isoform X2 [Xenia sp. Carnegie-2017]XP_046859489.1 SPARC-related modular calcium-binding protein 1-like isoform X2 [Xenia sp. Carnegie-2017]
MILSSLDQIKKAGSNSNCKLRCNARDFSHPVCGSDGKTYQSKCLLRMEKCTSEKRLYIKSMGRCQTPRSCAEHKKRALKAIRERDLLQMGIFIPNCNKDGSYTGVQCTRNKFVCWCVDVNGVEIDRTRSSGRKPDCRYRRGNPNFSNERYIRMLKGCSKDHRNAFNKKLLLGFKKEFSKSSTKRGKITYKVIAEWKMNELDIDRNRFLSQKEVRALVKRIKKIFTPRKCGKTFFHFCDENNDLDISKSEWFACLGIKFEKPGGPKCFSHRARAKTEQKQNPSSIVFAPSCKKDGTYTIVQCENVSKYCWCVHPVTGKNIPNTSVQNARPDCSRSFRRTKRPTSSSTILLTPVRRSFFRISKNEPRNDKLSIRDVNKKKVKECDKLAWRRFRHEFVRIMRKELQMLTEPTRNSSSHTSRNIFFAISSRLSNTMIVSWKFSKLDVNRNRLIRMGELFSPQMKKIFGKIRRGRKCSKKLSTQCDLDRNGGLSLHEWKRCLV